MEIETANKEKELIELSRLLFEELRDMVSYRDHLSEATVANVRLIHVGYQQRYLCPEEGPSIWEFCDYRSADILRDRPDYELRPVYAVEA